MKKTIVTMTLTMKWRNRKSRAGDGRDGDRKVEDEEDKIMGGRDKDN